MVIPGWNNCYANCLIVSMFLPQDYPVVARNYTSFSLDPTLKRSEMTEHPSRDDDNPSEDLRGSQPSAIILTQPKSAIKGGSAPRDNLYSPERQRSLGHIDEPQRQISSEDLVT